MSRKQLRMVLLATVLFGGRVACVHAATDYFVVGNKGNASPALLHIFSYDTATTTVTFRATITNAANCNMDMGLSALPNHGFVLGHRYAPNIQRYGTRDRVTWTSEVTTVDINQAGPGAFWDSGVRTNRDPSKGENYAVGVAMLKDGKLFVTGDRLQSNTVYYGLGDLSGKSGSLTTNVFPRDLNHLGVMANTTGAGDQVLWDVTSTIEGTASRFVTACRGINGAVLAYNSDGTYKGALTPVGTGRHGVGVSKSAKNGDLVLQVNDNGAYPATVSVKGIYVDDARFDTAAFSFSRSFPTSTNFFNSLGVPDVDGLESGRIIVLETLRRGGQATGSYAGVMVFGSRDGGVTWTNEMSQPLLLVDAINAPASLGGETIAGLYTIHPPPGTFVCFR